MLPNLYRLSTLRTDPVSGKRKQPYVDQPQKNKRMEQAFLEQVAYRGGNGIDALDVCLQGGHFAWSESTALDYAIGDNATLGYVIEASPLCMYLTGAQMQHGGQWWNYYDAFKVDDDKEPGYWSDMVELVGSWQKSIAANEVREEGEPSHRTKESYIQTLYWKRPTSTIASLLETAGTKPCPAWDAGEDALLKDWKIMVHSAIQAAPWNHPGPSTDEFVATGGNLASCINKVTEHYTDVNNDDDRNVKVVYELEEGVLLGSREAANRFWEWYSDTD